MNLPPPHLAIKQTPSFAKCGHSGKQRNFSGCEEAGSVKEGSFPSKKDGSKGCRQGEE